MIVARVQRQPWYFIAAVGLCVSASAACNGLIGEPHGTVLDLKEGKQPESAGGLGGNDGSGGTDVPDGNVPPVTSDPPAQVLPEPIFKFHDLSVPAPFTGLRMLTNSEYQSTIADAVGVTPDISDLPVEIEVTNLRNDSAYNVVRDGLHMRELFEVANDVAATADPQRLPCGQSSACDTAELAAYFAVLAPASVSTEQLADYETIYANATALRDHEFATRAVLQMALMSPAFLYRSELGDGDGQLTPGELAAKLSYFLWGGPPDPELRALATDGTLTDATVYATQVDRMLSDARATNQIVWFMIDWLGIDHLDLVSKNDFPTFPAGLQDDMLEEVARLISTVIVEEGRPLSALFTNETTWLNERLAQHYGIGGVTGDSFREVSLVGTERRGILTTAALLAAHSKESGRSPMQRGKFIVDVLTCHDFPAEAGEAQMSLAPDDGSTSFRDRFAPLETTAPCQNCHRTLNAGFAFDIFDHVGGRFDETEVSMAETGGRFVLPPYDVLEFDDTSEALAGFATHGGMQRCFVNQAYRFANGRLPGAQDAATLGDLESAFSSDDDVIELFRLIALSDQFRAAQE